MRTPESRFDGLDKLGYNFPPNYLSVDVRSTLQTHYKEHVETTLGMSNGPDRGRQAALSATGRADKEDDEVAEEMGEKEDE